MLKTFPQGGIHPEENKISATAKIQSLPLPRQVSIPLAQHIGAPAVPIVQRGDMVKTGTLIAKAGGFVSANIHSSVSGKVKKIDEVTDTSGYKKPCIIIDVDGDEWEESINRDTELNKDLSATPEEIRQKIMDAGVVGLGGATFPSHIKLFVPDGKKVEYLVINAVECEPYLTADHRIMLEKPHEIMIGVSLMMKAVGVSNAIIGIENNKPDAVKLLREVSQEYQGIKIEPLKVQYPQGGEKQLIKAVLNREVPSGGLPLDVGCVVQNVGTTVAIYEAVQKNKPLIERVVTVTGKSVKNPINVLTRIGTSAEVLIEAAGGLPKDTGKIVNGGPMMGRAISETDIPVTKGTGGILIFSKKESKRVKSSNCIRCARCTFVCPQGLEPFNLKNLTNVNNWESLEKEHVTDCIECGSCSYTCPAGLPLLDYIRLGKSTVSQIIRSRKN